MKIALVCPFNMLSRPGGIPQEVRNLHKGLAARGHDVKVITQKPSNFKGRAPEGYILIGVTRTFRGGFGTEGSWGWPSDSEEIAKILEEEKFDVINFHEPWMPMLAWQMVKHSQAVHVGTFHANLMDTAAGKAWTIFKPYGYPIIRSMDLVTATSPASAGMLLARANRQSSIDRDLVKNLTYTPCGVDLSIFKPFKKRQPLTGPNTKTIVYMGRLEKRKGADWLLLAFAELVKDMPEAHLIVAGAGLNASRLRQFVREERIKNVSFPGYVTDEQKRYLIGNSDLNCFPSPYGEGFGIVLLESMAMGTPLLAGNNLGYINVMKGPGRIGLVDPMATKDFANRLAVFLTDETQRKLMTTWALKSVKQYDLPKIVDKYEAAYKKAIALHSAKSKANRYGDKSDARHKKIISRLFVRRQPR